MKLRPRVKVPTDNSNTMTATVPVLPPNMLRLQTPPISEVSNAGSTVARKNRLSELSSSIMSISDPEETIDSVSPTKNRDRPKIAVPAAPLTKRNLAKYQEEMASEHEHSPPPPTPNTRLTQARNYLMTEGIISDPEFESRGLQIAEYLYSHGHGKEKYEIQLRKEVAQLLKHHDFHAAGSSEQPPQHWPSMTRSEASTPVMSLPAEDDPDPEEQADPFEWNNKLDDLTDRVTRRPSGGKEAFAFSELRELARPLNGGRLPSLGKAQRLINEQMVRENHENRSSNQTDDDRLWAFEKYLPPASKEKKFSLDRWSGRPPGRSRAATLTLGEGNLMPQEMMDIDWDRDRAKLEESLVGYDDVDRGEAQLLLAETPLLQALMSDQIERDLAPRSKKGEGIEPVARKPAVLMTQKFALPRPAQFRIDEAAEIAKSLNIHPDPPTPSPRTALFLKRKFEQCSDSESDGDEGEERRPEPPVGRGDDGQGERVCVDETVSSSGSLV